MKGWKIDKRYEKYYTYVVTYEHKCRLVKLPSSNRGLVWDLLPSLFITVSKVLGLGSCRYLVECRAAGESLSNYFYVVEICDCCC